MASLENLEQDLKSFVGRHDRATAETKSRLLQVEQALTAPRGGGGGYADDGEDIGHKLIESEGYKNLIGNNGKTTGRVQVKTLYERKTNLVSYTGLGQPLVPPQIVPGVIRPGQMKLRVRDLMPNNATASNLIEYTKETSHDDATAIQVNEGDVKGEGGLGFTLSYVPIRTIASWIPVSTQILNDAPSLQAYINQRLMYFNGLKIENELLNGSGVGTEISGLRTQATAFDTTRVNVATDSMIDVIGLAMSQAAESLFDPDAVILHPKDWSRIQRTKTATTNAYIFSDPHSAAGDQIWGVPVVQSWNMPESEFLTGSFAMGAAVWDRMQASIEISREHSDFFTRNLAAILCESRLALTVYRPEAFVTAGFPYGS